MFGKNHKKYLQIFSAVLSIAVIASMVMAYFSLLF